MAHDIMNRNGVDHMFVVGDRDAAWHKLGQRTPEAVNWETAMGLAGLQWEVEKRPLYAKVPATVALTVGDLANTRDLARQLQGAGEYKVMDGAYGVFRNDDNAFLGVVGQRYMPIQNRDAFNFVDVLLESVNGAHYDSAGALGNGERVWCSAKVPFDFEPVAGDTHQTYLMFSTSHDGQSSAVCKLTTVRVVCANTLAMATSETNATVRIRHTASAQDRLGRAALLMRGVGNTVAALNNKLTRLSEVALTDEMMENAFRILFPTNGEASTRRSNTVEQIMGLYRNNDGQRAIPGVAGTAYNLLNAVTEYADHYRGVRGADGTVEGLAAARAESALFGTADMLKTQALDTLVELVG